MIRVFFRLPRSMFLVVVLLVHGGPDAVSQEEKVAAASDAQSAPEAQSLYTNAANFQNSGAFDRAAEEWSRLLARFPDDPSAAKARYYLGVCQVQLKQFADAAESFQQVLAKYPAFAQLEETLRNLGWCRYKLGVDGDASQYPQAVDVFEKLINDYANGKFIDEAMFFQGESLYALGKHKEAALVYGRLVTGHPDSKIRPEALYALGVTLEEMSAWAQASKAYDIFLEEYGTSALLTEVRMRKAETLLQLGDVAQAEKLFAEVTAVPTFPFADHALMRQAFCATQQDKLTEATALYTLLLERYPQSRDVPEATLSGGRCFYRMLKFEEATEWLDKAVALGGEGSVEAAHWLCRIHLEAKRPEQALQLADAVLPHAGDSPFVAHLKLDRADALFETETAHPGLEGSTAVSPGKSGQKWALLIGVNDYTQLNDLRFCQRDAEALRTTLIAAGFVPENVFLIASGAANAETQPFKANIERQLGVVLSVAEKGDVVLISFSGHGMHIDGKTYLCPSEADPRKAEETMIALNAVYRQLSECSASQKMFWVDACRDDPWRVGGRSARRNDSESTHRELASPPEGVLVLASCKEGQISWDDEESRHGTFMHFLLEGLSGKADQESGNRNGMVSLLELFQYTSALTKRTVAQRRQEVQTPVFFGEITGDFELVESGLNDVPVRLVLHRGSQDGPLLASAELRLTYRAHDDTAERVLGLGTTDAGGTVSLAIPRTLVSTDGGQFSVIVKHEGRTQRRPLPHLSKQTLWHVHTDERLNTVLAHGGSPGCLGAIERGVRFLHGCQFPDGRWALDRLPSGIADSTADARVMNADTGATGLTLLALVRAGQPDMAGTCAPPVNAGVRWLQANQQEDGQLYSDETDQEEVARMYGHGIATIALCDAYAVTRDPPLRETIDRAIAFIVDAQSEARGGWRYTPGVSGDTSVSGWQLDALTSAQRVGIEIPGETLRAVSRWLDAAQASPTQPHLYCYNPFASDTPEQRTGRSPSLAMTAAGLHMRLLLGVSPDAPEIRAGADYLRQNLPRLDEYNRDVYYWYHATEVMFQVQGDHWRDWSESLIPAIVGSQVTAGPWAGSWSPTEPAADRWGFAGGRVYCSALNLMTLEILLRASSASR